jgi:putative peptide maturation system protein
VSRRGALDDAHATLAALAAVRAPPADALTGLATLRAAHPEWSWDLVWDEEPAAERFHYELLIGVPSSGTVALGLTPPDAVPFPLRGLQRWKEMEVARVDGRAVWMHEVTALFDPLWGEADLHRQIVEHCVIRRALEAMPDEVTDDALQAAVDAFRAAHGLDTAAATEAWLAEHGITLAELEAGLEGQLRLPRLRREVTSGAADVFSADPARYDEIQLVAFPAADAVALAAEVRAGTGFYAIAERELGRRRDAASASRSVVFATHRRRDLASDEAVVEGSVAAVRIHGAGPYVAWIRAVAPARWSDATAAAIEADLFAAWLAERRRAARVEWNWGRG